jgi:hypothetical protein
LQRVEAEALPVRVESGQRCRAGDVCDPRSGLDRARDLGDRLVGDADQHELGGFRNGEAALAQASGDSRADAAGADDLDAVEHCKLQFRSGYRAL